MLRRLGALLPFARYRIEGASMAPSFSSGERVVVNRAVYWFRRPRAGDVVLVRDPRETDRLLIKRIERVADGHYAVVGDNPDASTDSRAFGLVPRELVLGKVWFRY
jgi:nickel-type superoxide dismutase maturation protease